QQSVDCFVGQWIGAPELRVEISRVVRNVGKGVRYLVVVALALFIMRVLDCDARGLAEWHRPIRVEAAGRIDRDRHAADIAALAPSIAEKVSQRRFDRGRRFAVPVDTQY